MTQPRAHLTAVPDDGPFVYPIPAGTRLESHGWFAWWHGWWRNSEFRIRADRDVRAIWFDLLNVAQDEDPVGTLPIQDDMLAFHARVPLEEWRRFMARPLTPLYGWQPCVTTDGARKFYHPRLLEVTLSAVRFRAADATKKAEDRERKRLDALKTQIVRAGGSERMAADEAYRARLDEFLTDTLPAGATRTRKVVLAAMEAIALQDQGARAI